MLGSPFDLFNALDSIATTRSRRKVEGSEASEITWVELDRGISEAVVSVQERRQRQGIPCPVCETQMSISAENELSEFGDLNVTVRQMNCPTCGMLANRIFHPSVGYDFKIIR